MRNFKVSVFQVFLLSLGLNATFAWSQQSADSVLEPPLQRLNNANDDLEETSASDNVNFIPLIFDAVLIDYAELSETDDEGQNLINAIELSALPSSANSSAFIRLNATGTDPAQLNFSITQLEENILEFELEGGVYDYRLSELYLGVGNTYQQLDESQLAIDAFNEALQLSRINDGLFTENQLPIVDELVESYLNLGDIPSANLNQEYLFYIQQKIYGAAHPIILTELLEYADWNLYAANLGMGFVPDSQAIHLNADSLNENNFNQTEQLEDLLTAATFAYSQAIAIQHELEARFAEDPNSVETIALKNDLNFSNEDLDIPATELKLAYTFFLQFQFDQNNVAVNAYGEAPSTYFLDSQINGRRALERRYAYLQDSNRPTIEIINALVDIADWYLFFERWTTAEEIYVQVFELMELNNIEHINGLSYPDLPVNIPSFLGSSYSRLSNRIPPEAVLDYAGYVDVSFELSRFARPTRIRINSSSEGTTLETERALLRRLRSSTFRRQLVDRTEYSESAYSIRYYYTVQLPDED